MQELPEDQESEELKFPGLTSIKKHWTHKLSFMVVYDDMTVLYCTIKKVDVMTFINSP